ncbi:MULTISPECIES: sulfate ABC transporter permease subunit CysW [Vibrio]|jgi:sulfate transport system permease protein|uniref:Sulfate transport system permease protein CysW n=1 Tax=Vibrio diazotrophicus TaxID=685 RepID=A0A2J8H4Q5_VIBDI|nr:MULTISPECIES: sulfate ABC transporter permease subunit CysW [Vibrio]MCF7361335.1 sulfate ABC transporter permease subunit CysW [Vibrio sp. A1-b2]MCZ4370847.1 sulfate ABC transporter permease subunit CysW [Vibrio diazotrophicus]PNH89039.1 sulfate ABC transporter permease subunit CysW [Vibrio diazotrophicus]PNH93262.1 sulfate ABC transporter permease subunit CysW [Vibrio diazotrophicus]PNH99979.1 sulfate ABC transporter permease subunit CysW [Vibrio diazotrophicus]
MSSQRTANQRPLRVGEQPWVKWSLISLALFFVAVLLLIPLLSIFQQAFASGLETYITNLSEPDTLHAIGLTLVVALLTVPINLVFGVMLAWSVTRFEFTGRKFLTTLIDIPFAVSPVVAGLLYLLLYGSSGWLGEWLYERDLQIMFAWPGIVLVTVFVTCPFVARELIPLMQQQGRSDEEAAVILGASWWQLFRRVTLPNIKWALIYGVILTNARAVGEFGAVAVVSGNIRGETNTLPLHVQLLYEDYQSEAAFASASLLAFIALLTLILKAFVEWRQERNHVIKQEQQGTL